MEKGYVPATYSNILDQMLARGAVPGQGGHLEADAGEAKRATARLDTYPFFAVEINRVFGMDKSCDLLKEAVRTWSRYRGNDIRREVEGRGLPLDVRHLTEYWDTPRHYSGLPTLRETTVQDPHYVASEYPGCPHHDLMKDLCPPPLAFMMCEEDHRAIAREFNPAIEVWYPALLTRGQAKCIFRFTMQREDAEKAARQAALVSEAARQAGRPLAGERQPMEADAATAYRALSRLNVIFYHFVVNELLRQAGEKQTEEITRETMKKWGTWRGRVMREDHLRRGWPLDLKTFITCFDDPSAGDAWVAENVIVTPSEHRKDVISSAYTMMFDTLGTGRFSTYMVEEGYPSQAAAYNPQIKVTIPELMERGDSISRVCYTLETS